MRCLWWLSSVIARTNKVPSSVEEANGLTTYGYQSRVADVLRRKSDGADGLPVHGKAGLRMTNAEGLNAYGFAAATRITGPTGYLTGCGS